MTVDMGTYFYLVIFNKYLWLWTWALITVGLKSWNIDKKYQSSGTMDMGTYYRGPEVGNIESKQQSSGNFEQGLELRKSTKIL